MALAPKVSCFNVDPEALLLQSHGFLVDAIPDEPIGVVDDVLVDEQGRAQALVVRSGWFGRRRFTVSVDDVAEISPGSRRLRLRLSAASRASKPSRD